MEQLRGLITPPETEDRGNKKAVLILAGVVCLLVVGVLLLSSKGKERKKRSKEVQDRPVAARELDSKQTQPRQDLRYKSSYSGLALNTVPEQPALPLYERPQEAPEALGKSEGQPVAASSLHTMPPLPPEPLPPARGIPPEPPRRETHGGQMPAQGLKNERPKKAEKEKKRTHWLEEQQKVLIEKPPFEVKEDGKQSQAGESIFPKAVWAIPADPTKVLYASQMIKGLILHDINTDLPGELRVLVTEQVEDRWGQGNVLIAQWSTLLGSQTGGLRYGQERMDTTFRGIELPNGAVIRFEGKAGDGQGAAGIPLKVDRHLPQLILGVGLTALMNIGARVPFGSPGSGQYQQNLPQEFSQDFAQGVNQAGQQVIHRELQRNPTGKQRYAYPVSIFFKENISFQTPPVVVSK